MARGIVILFMHFWTKSYLSSFVWQLSVVVFPHHRPDVTVLVDWLLTFSHQLWWPQFRTVIGNAKLKAAFLFCCCWQFVDNFSSTRVQTLLIPLHWWVLYVLYTFILCMWSWHVFKVSVKKKRLIFPFCMQVNWAFASHCGAFFSVTSYLHLSPIACTCTWLMRINYYVMGTELKFQTGYLV